MESINVGEFIRSSVNITNSIKSIRSLFQLSDAKTKKLNYSPPYQRDYVWSEKKATFFIETIFLHAEFPPIILYEKEDVYEVIDGRQRCETINLFLKNILRLKGSGLDKLWYLSNKKFSNLSDRLQERIEDAKVRVIIVKIRSVERINPYVEELVIRELFKRYNRGISPLKKEEVFQAQYLQDKINIHFKRGFEQDPQLYKHVKEIFDHNLKSQESLMQNIRQILVLHYIPINKYIHEREDVVNKYYDYWSYKNTDKENIQTVFNEFKEKIFFLLEIKTLLDKQGVISNRFMFECLYWALSVCEAEKVSADKVFHSSSFKSKLLKDIVKNVKIYCVEKNNYVQQIKSRHDSMADFFSKHLNISFTKYLKSSKEFLITHNESIKKYMQDRFMPGMEEDYFSKVIPTSITIVDILDKMKRGKFDLRPPYQRKEVMNSIKASALIESILLGFKLHPIYVFVRRNGVTEVIDGQQRLLAILGYMGEEFRDETGGFSRSEKHAFALNIKSGFLNEIDGMRFCKLPEIQKESIRSYDLDVIEIREEENTFFCPEELYKRLNYKPYPIKEHTFEYWNSYIDFNVIDYVKRICDKNKWLYLRKVDKRMFNKELVVGLIYLDYMTRVKSNLIGDVKSILSIYISQSQVLVKIRNKSHITRILENQEFRDDFIKSIDFFEMNFVEKVKELLTANSNETDIVKSRELDVILRTGIVRIAMSFYLLWWVLKGIPLESVRDSKKEVKANINKIFDLIYSAETINDIESAIINIWNVYCDNDKLVA